MAIHNTSAETLEMLLRGFRRAAEDGELEAALLALTLMEREIMVQRAALRQKVN